MRLPYTVGLVLAGVGLTRLRVGGGAFLAVSTLHQHLLFWGGMRGALAPALALSLPAAVMDRDKIVLAAFGAVAFSVVVQGVTMLALLRRLKI